MIASTFLFHKRFYLYLFWFWSPEKRHFQSIFQVASSDIRALGTTLILACKGTAPYTPDPFCERSTTSAALRLESRFQLIHCIKKEAGHIYDAVCHMLTQFIFFSFTSVGFIFIRLIAPDLIDIGLCDLIVHHFFFRCLIVFVEFSFLCKNFSELL